MKKLFIGLCLISMISMNISCYATEIKVLANTSIYISPIDTVTSKDMSIDNINAEIVNDVCVGENAIFKAGDKATLHIGEIEKARCWGKAGKITVSNGYAYDVNGNKHKILVSKNYYGEEKTWPKTCGIVSLFLLWPLAFCGFVHGGQACVSASSEIETSLASEFCFSK